MTSSSTTIAQLGTGTMGFPIAGHLATAGFTLRVWNRSRAKAEPLAGSAVTVTDSPAEAVTGADLVITSLFDADSVEQTVRKAAGSLRPGTVWIQLSTVGVQGSEQLARLAAELDLVYVDAPVLGTRKPAEDGELVILASGPDSARAVCEPVFEVIGSRTLWVGPAGAGSRLKLVANAWVLALVEGIAESLKLAEGLGLDPKLFAEALRGGAADAPYVQLKGSSMLARDWTPAFGLAGAEKDAGLILSAAEQAGVDMGITRVARQYQQQAISDGHGEEDLSVIYLAHRSS